MRAPTPPPAVSESRQGQYAGAVSRLVAFAADVGASWGAYTVGAGIVSLTIQLVAGRKFSLSNHQVVALVVLAVWEFLYFAYQWSLNGKTLGMALLGIQVVTAEGDRITPRQALVRTLTLPLSFLALGLGFLGILLRKDRRAWQDRFARTCVVYSWDARAARLRWLAHQEHGVHTSKEKPSTGSDAPAPPVSPASSSRPSTPPR